MTQTSPEIAVAPRFFRSLLVSRAHSYQLVTSKTLAGTELRVSLGHVTTEASLAKIDPDTGLQFDDRVGCDS